MSYKREAMRQYAGQRLISLIEKDCPTNARPEPESFAHTGLHLTRTPCTVIVYTTLFLCPTYRSCSELVNDIELPGSLSWPLLRSCHIAPNLVVSCRLRPVSHSKQLEPLPEMQKPSHGPSREPEPQRLEHSARQRLRAPAAASELVQQAGAPLSPPMPHMSTPPTLAPPRPATRTEPRGSLSPAPPRLPELTALRPPLSWMPILSEKSFLLAGL